MKILFLFIDGVGIREIAGDNPVNTEVCPTLCDLVARHGKPIDATMGVEGAPQSATGQATMFTGVNCPAALGRHREGFPNKELREIIENDNIFKRLGGTGKKVAFANAYLMDALDEVKAIRFKSVTTVMALTMPETVRLTEDLFKGRALTPDFTFSSIQDTYPDLPVITPRKAAERLFSIAKQNDFTLYEFFQSDVAGHSLDYAKACEVLRIYDKFLQTLRNFCEAARITLVLTSDHGNVEEIKLRGHTRNPVPFVAFGPKERELRASVESLQDVTPAIMDIFLKTK